MKKQKIIFATAIFALLIFVPFIQSYAADVDQVDFDNAKAGTSSSPVFFGECYTDGPYAYQFDEDEIRLTSNIDLGEDFIQLLNQKCVIDLNGFTISTASEYNATFEIERAQVTFTGNGTINAYDSGSYVIELEDGSNVTIENGTYNGGIAATYGGYGNDGYSALIVNGGIFKHFRIDESDVTINNATIDARELAINAIELGSSGALVINNANVYSDNNCIVIDYYKYLNFEAAYANARNLIINGGNYIAGDVGIVIGNIDDIKLSKCHIVGENAAIADFCTSRDYEDILGIDSHFEGGIHLNSVPFDNTLNWYLSQSELNVVRNELNSDIETHIITFNRMSGNSWVESLIGNKVEGQHVIFPEDPTKSDCRFEGWYYDRDLNEDSKVDVDNDFPTFSPSTMVYAKWVEDEQEPEKIDRISLNFDKTAEINSEYTFGEWNENFATSMNANSTTCINMYSDEAYLAYNNGNDVWVKGADDEYLNTTSTYGIVVKVYPTGYYYFDEDDINNNNIIVCVNNGVEFTSWKALNYNSDSQVLTMVIPIDSITYRVTFNTGSMGLMTKQSVKQNKKVSPPNLNYPGHTLEGWFYVDMTTPFDFNTPIRENTFLYAKWTENSVTAPTANQLTYNGQMQDLITAGSTSNGTIKYSLDNQNWSTEIPQRKDAGEYTVYYKVFGDNNQNDGETGSVVATIAKVNPEYIAPTANQLTYNNGMQGLVTAGRTKGGTIKYSLDNQNWSTEIPRGKVVGTYIVYYRVFGDNNHNDSETGSVVATISYADGLNKIDSVWYYCKNNQIQTDFTGLVEKDGTLYYIQRGELHWGVNTLIKHDGTWYYIKNSMVDNSYTGLVQKDGTWFYVQNGVLHWGVETLVKRNGTWFYVKNSMVDWNYTGLVKKDGAWFYVQKGVLHWGVETLVKRNGTWFYVKNSMVDWNYTGLVKKDGVWYYVQKGKLVWGVETLVKRNGTWYYVKNSMVNWNYTGLVKKDGTLYYVQKGVLKWGYNGTKTFNGKKYTIKNSMVVK